jgi:fibronectin-binding autotransporter adhesin
LVFGFYSGTVTISNAISGTGSLTQNGSTFGALVLTGNNTYSGTTTISSGILQIGNAGTTGTLGTGSVNGYGTLKFDRSDDITESGAISGSVTLAQAGAGVLTLTASNTYTGATSVNAGTPRLGGSGALPTGASAGTITLDAGGTLDLGGYNLSPNALAGGGTVTTSSTGLRTLTLGTSNADSTFAGVITDGSGQLSLTKAGSGTLTLT